MNPPDDWKVASLAELESDGAVRLGRGEVISRRAIEAHPGHYPIYSSSAARQGLFGRYGAFMFDEELITWSIDGGGHFFYRPKHRFSVTNVCGFMRLDTNQINYRFFAYQLQLLHSRLQFDYLYKAHPSVIRTAYQVALPSLPEQQAIAKALSDVDDLIESLEQLIDKKKMTRVGAAQSLLSGERRLPGHASDWIKCRLGDMGTFSKGGGISKSDLTPDGLACILYGEIYTNHNDWIRSFSSRIPPEVAARAEPLQPGDLLFTGSGETAEDIGKCVVYLGTEDKAFAGGDIVILRGAQADPKFLGYALNSASAGRQKTRLAQGATVVHLNARQIAQVEVSLPSVIDEQRAIAEVLSDMDAEIDALIARRAKTVMVKQAMMHELLAGKTRLA